MQVYRGSFFRKSSVLILIRNKTGCRKKILQQPRYVALYQEQYRIISSGTLPLSTARS